MATETIRAFSAFINGRKIGQFSGGSFEVDSGDEPNFGDNEGVIVYSDGITETKIEMKTYEPVGGIDADILSQMLAKTDIPCTFSLINGKIQQVTLRCLKASYTGEWKSGKMDGSYTFAGGAPRQT